MKILDKIKQIINPTISTATIVAPVGVAKSRDKISPSAEQTTAKIAEKMVTDLKLLKIRIADNAGKTTSAEIKSEPTKFIAITIITAKSRNARPQ